jgi:hypothetical protein
VTAALGMEPRLLRLLTAVHEAGHVIAAATVGLKVTRAWVTWSRLIGAGGTGFDYSCYPSRIIPLPDLLAMNAAGFQATYTWLEGRGIDGNADPYDFALNAMASADIGWCQDACRQLGRPDLTMQDGIHGAGRILKHRWRAVLRLAYALASQGALPGAELQPYLLADPAQHAEAVIAYHAWRDETGHLWRRDVRCGSPAAPGQRLSAHHPPEGITRG